MGPIFLESGSVLPWQKPVKRECISLLHLYNGSTEPTNQIGFESMDAELGPYKIIASAVKYEADIIHLDRLDPIKHEQPAGEKKHEILFDGGITIYKKEEAIAGTSFSGYDFKLNGRIWKAVPAEKIYMETGGLKHLVLGENDSLERIGAIIDGYEMQKEEEEKNKAAESMNAWRAGQESERWSP